MCQTNEVESWCEKCNPRVEQRIRRKKKGMLKFKTAKRIG